MNKIFLLSIPLSFLCFFVSSNCMHRKMACMAHTRNNDRSRELRDKKLVFGRTNGRATHSTIKKDEKPSPQSVITTLDLKTIFAPVAEAHRGCTTCMTCTPGRLATGLLFVLMFAQLGQAVDIVGQFAIGQNFDEDLDLAALRAGCIVRKQGLGTSITCEGVSSVQQHEYARPEKGSAGTKVHEDMHKRQDTDSRETRTPKISGTRAMDIGWGDTPVSEETARIQREVEEENRRNIHAVVYG